MINNPDFAAVSLGALLHDIGKVGQRAFPHLEGLSHSSLQLESTLCPQAKQGYSTRLHVLHTNELCERIASALPKSINASDVANLASYHHKPATDLDRIIQEADAISAQTERDAATSSSARPEFRKARLHPVVAGISVSDQSAKGGAFEYPIAEYSTDDLFPEAEESNDQTKSYRVIWEGLLERLTSLRIDDEIKFINTCLSVLEYYTWSVPSATNLRIRDISLFDHLRSTSAIAGCMCLSENTEKRFLLVAGRFGGIQKYITGQRSSSRGFAKSLRGRSFEVAAFSDLAAFGILSSLGMPLTQVFMSAGGQFHLLLPNDGEVITVLQEHEAKIHQDVVSQHAGTLRFDIAWLNMSDDELRNDSPAKIRELGHLLHEKSLKGPTTLRSANGWSEQSWVLPGFDGTHEELCRSCGVNKATAAFGESDDPICDKCKMDRDLGSKIVRSPFMTFHFRGNGEYNSGFGSFGLPKKLSEDDRRSSVVVSFSDELPSIPDMPLFRVLRNNYVPMDTSNSVMEFSEIAKNANGAPYLAYLKADVDNLGFIFSKGLTASESEQKDRSSMSRIATLSRSLEYFFSGYLRSLLEERFPLTYTVYTGGDDLLLIGPWNHIFDLASELRSEFDRYTCHNEAWGISAGIAVAGSYSPLTHCLSEAERYLDHSKSADGKDSISLLGTRLKWGEYDRFLEQGRQLTSWLENGTVNSGKIYRLMEAGERLKLFVETGNTDYLKAIPQLIYDLSRNWGERTDSDRDAKRWAQSFCNPEHPDLKILPLICRYAILRSR